MSEYDDCPAEGGRDAYSANSDEGLARNDVGHDHITDVGSCSDQPPPQEVDYQKLLKVRIPPPPPPGPPTTTTIQSHSSAGRPGDVILSLLKATVIRAQVQ